MMFICKFSRKVLNMERIIKHIVVTTSLLLIALLTFKCDVYATENNGNEARFVNERISAFGKNGKYFDHVAYADTYPDLYNAFGYNKSALWSHYVNNGVYENRNATSTIPSVSSKLVALNALASVTNQNMSDREKATAIHDWIVNNTRYDYTNYMAGTIPNISYTKEGVFLNHVAVCSGYAEAYCYMARILGLKCDFIGGTATNSIGNTGGHAWNRVMIDGGWLYVDCTWDDPVSSDGSDILRYDYLLLSEEAMARNHRMESIGY